MDVATRSVMRRVRSRDGTDIAYWTSGQGPPLVLVHGVAADHTRWKPLLPGLDPHVTVHVMDRRGRGASGDASDYALVREYEDVAAVVDAVAATSGSQVDLYGHSHGGFCAFGAAHLTPNVRRLVLYEGWPLPDPAVYALPAELEGRLDTYLAAGDRDQVLEVLFRELLGMPENDLAELKAAPSWAGRTAAAHTIPREIRGEAGARLVSAEAAKITCPVVLVIGERSADPTRAGVEDIKVALPDARIIVLEDQGHVADILTPRDFAERLLSCLRVRA